MLCYELLAACQNKMRVCVCVCCSLYGVSQGYWGTPPWGILLFALSARPQNKLLCGLWLPCCHVSGRNGPSRTGGCLPPSSQSEKLKIKSRPRSGFGCHPAQPLAGSTAPTFHDFRTFPKLRQQQREEGSGKVRRAADTDASSWAISRPGGTSGEA